MSLGPEYGREVCSRAGVQPEKPAKDVAMEEASKLFRALEDLGNEKPKPSLYSGFVSPFPLHMLSERPRELSGLSEAFDEFFSDQQIELVKEDAVHHVTEEKEKVERIAEQQAQADEKWVRIISESQEKANLIYNNYPIVQAALEGIGKAKASGMEWDEIKKAVQGEQTPEAESIKEIREGDGVVIMDLGGKDVELQFNRSVEENAARYYEDAKWAKRKLGGLGEARKESQERLERAQEKEEKVLGEDFRKLVFPREKPASGDEEVDTDSPEGKVAEEEAEEQALESLEPSDEEAKPAEPKKRRKRWYEKFRWFFSSDGFLVVAGKSAESNEVLIKKHTDPTDIVFHADIPGAAFVVIKSQGMDVTEVTKREAAEFSAANSKAWARGLGTIDIFSVPRSRVSKSPPSGQYLPKGSFMVEGEREWYKNLELKLAVGVKVDGEENEARVVSGPVMAVRKHSDYFITLKPGLKKSLELARLMKNKILVKARPDDRYLIEQVPLEEFQVVVPSGMADVVEHAGEAV
jgi:predicted ribosome quality control (RQC) complex YloA/Tae2 family protein